MMGKLAQFSDGVENQSRYMTMLLKHLPYAESIYTDYDSVIPGAGFVHTGASREDGIRTIANYAYFYSFLYTNMQHDSIGDNPRDLLLKRARSCIVYLVETHRCNGSFVCTDGNNWGKIWQSAMWSGYLGVAAWLIWDFLDDRIREMTERLITSEADHIASIQPPIKEWSDTKAEENGWDSNILALAANMFPNHPHASLWNEKAILYIMNTLSLEKDLADETLIDGRPVKDWVLGANLHPDFTMENHDIFHPVYQMVVHQELGTSALFYRMGGSHPPEAIKHHQLDNWHHVLKWILLPDGEWLYPNGLDWMIHDYEHLASLTCLAVYFREPEAMLYESIVADRQWKRQERQTDGSFFGGMIDIGPRRESVAVQRLIDAYFYHTHFGSWTIRDAEQALSLPPKQGTRYYPSTKIILHRNESKAASFSWQKKIMGMIAPIVDRQSEKPYATLPYPHSFVGHFAVKDRKKDFRYETHTVELREDGFSTTGVLYANEQTVRQHVSFTSLPGGLTVYMDWSIAVTKLTVLQEFGLPVCIEDDPVWGAVQGITHTEGSEILPEMPRAIEGEWIHLNSGLGIAVRGGQGMMAGDRSYKQAGTHASVLFFGSYSAEAREAAEGETLGKRYMAVAANLSVDHTRVMDESVVVHRMPPGWQAVSVRDPVSGTTWLVASNYFGEEYASLSPVGGIPGKQLHQPRNTSGVYEIPAT